MEALWLAIKSVYSMLFKAMSAVMEDTAACTTADAGLMTAAKFLWSVY